MPGKPSCAALPPRLRMNRIARTSGPMLDFELFCLAVSAVNGCPPWFGNPWDGSPG